MVNPLRPKPVRNPVRAAQKAAAKFFGMTNKALNKKLRKSGDKAHWQAMIHQAIEEMKNGKGPKE